MARIRQENRCGKCLLSTKVQGGPQGQPSSSRKGQDLYSVFPSYSGEVGSAGCPAPHLRQRRPPKERKWQTRADRWGRSGGRSLPSVIIPSMGEKAVSITFKRVTAWVGRASWGFCCFSSPPLAADTPRGEAPDPFTRKTEAASPTEVPPPSSPGGLGPPQSSSLRITAAFSVASVRMQRVHPLWVSGDLSGSWGI